VSLPLSIYSRLPLRQPYSVGFDKFSIEYAGAGNYILVGADPSLDDFSELTLEIMYKPLSAIQAPRLIWKSGWVGNGNFIIWVRAADFTVAFGVSDAGGTEYWIPSITPVNEVGCWFHIVGVYDGSDIYVYVNGVQENSTPAAAGTLSHLADVYISAVSADLSILGRTAFARVYNRALTNKEIYYNMLNYHNPIRDNLVMWLSMEEGVGTVTYDKSGYGNDGTFLPAENPPTWSRNLMWQLRSETNL